MADANLDAALQVEREARASRGVGLTGPASMDLELYGGAGVEYATELQDEEPSSGASARLASLPQRVIQQHNLEAEADGDAAMRRFRAENSSVSTAKIADREDEYRKNRQRLTLSPDRGGDAFAGAAPARSYAEILAAQQLAREKDELMRKLAKQQQNAELVARAEAQASLAAGGAAAAAASAASSSSAAAAAATAAATQPAPQPGRRRRMWDDAGPSAAASGAPPLLGAAGAAGAAYAAAPAPGAASWDATPLLAGGGGGGGGAGDATPLLSHGGSSASRWDETPLGAHGAAASSSSSSSSAAAAAAAAVAAAGRAKRSRWEETPVVPSAAAAAAAAAAALGATPLLSAGGATPLWGASAAAAAAGAAPPAPPALTSLQARTEYEMGLRNAPLSDEDLDRLLPAAGYRVLPPPPTYAPLRDPARKLLATPTPLSTPGFAMAPTPAKSSYGVALEAPPGEGGYEGAASGGVGGLPYVKPEDVEYFGALVGEAGAKAESELTPAEAKARLVAVLLLKIKNGAPPARKSAMRAITEKARELGAGPLFAALLPLLMSHALEDGERHVLVKVVGRVLFALDDLVRPYVHKILVVVEPMLIDDDYYARVEGRELVANLAKAAGLATMITVMRPDIDSPNEYHRNTTARALAVVAGALGCGVVLPFLRAVTASKKSWQARHTGCKVVQQTALLVGCGVLPHLGGLVEAVRACVSDGEPKVAIMAVLAVAALAEAAAPYGIEAFVGVLRPLVKSAEAARGKALAAALKAVGALLPLMDAAPAAFFTKAVMPTLLRECASPDEDMRKIVLRVLAQAAASEGVTGEYLRGEVLGPFFEHFWTRRSALERRTARAVVEATHALALRVGGVECLSRLAPLLKDGAETLRRMALEGVQRVVAALGVSSVAPRLEEELVDGMLYAFQEQGIGAGVAGGGEGGGGGEGEGAGREPAGAAADARVILSAFGTLLEALGARAAPYLAGIAGNIKWRLNLKSPTVRMLAADLVARVAPAMRACGADALLGHLGGTLYECLGEEYPEVLGSLLGGLRAVVAAVGLAHMQPPVKDLLPRLTPILKNRAEKVQEACIELVGRIAERAGGGVSPKEWMRVCMELLELLRAPRKAIRRAAVNTFGYIAKAVSPQDVLHALLNNLKVQERSSRVCTTVAIGIIAEACAPFTVLPALLNEYRTPDMNVQNGVLKSLSFTFEYIGEAARDYAYAVVPLLADALIDRDAVHRQTACAVVKHLALGLAGAGCEDALVHLLNVVWPNIFETSPHVIGAVLEAVEALRVSLGAGVLLAYVRGGLFHPARRVRDVYWRLYNNLVVYAGHALPAFLPRIPEEREEGEGEAGGSGGSGGGGGGGGSRYTRTVLELFV